MESGRNTDNSSPWSGIHFNAMLIVCTARYLFCRPVWHVMGCTGNGLPFGAVLTIGYKIHLEGCCRLCVMGPWGRCTVLSDGNGHWLSFISLPVICLQHKSNCSLTLLVFCERDLLVTVNASSAGIFYAGSFESLAGWWNVTLAGTFWLRFYVLQ